MKTLSIMFCMFLVQQFFAQEVKTTTITVVIENIKTDEGAVLGSLFTKNTFLSSNPELTAKGEIRNGSATLIFNDVPEGVYGITAFYDENGNGSMDFEATGMPQELYGSSNNKFNPYGPPTWSDARFEAKGPTMEHQIRLTR